MPRQLKLVGPSDRPPGEGWRDELIYGRDGLKDCRENVIYMLRDHAEWHGVLGADIFAKSIAVRKPSPLGHEVGHVWTPDDDVQLGIWLAQREQLVVRSEETLSRAVAFVSKSNPFHPVREFLDGLQWDQDKRLDTWASRYLGTAATQYASRVGRYFLLNLVRRAYEPGCVMRSLPVLEGPQNIGKSTVSRLLAEPWFSDTPFDLGNLKDVYLVIQGVWLYEVAELDSFGKSDITRVKAFISSTKDRYRAPYDRAVQDQPREACFIATTNAQEYLRDWSGGTRFWPLKCGAIDLNTFEAARDQLLAEAVAIYKAGGETSRAYPTSAEEDELFAPEQDERLSVHPWFSVIANYLDEHQNIDSLTVTEVIREALHIAISDMGRNVTAEQIVGRTMAKLRWTKRRDAKADSNGQRPWRWYRPPKAEPKVVDPDEVPF